MQKLSSDYWTERYKVKDIGWDLGEISPPLKAYIDQLEDQSIKILIPGCGNGYEGRYLWEKGFKNIFFLDYSALPLNGIRGAHPEIPDGQFLIQDFFTLQDSFDLILEQTLFCALHPSLRDIYAKQVSNLLRPKGKLVGLLFDKQFEGGPPFGGSKEEYMRYFSPYFCSSSIRMESCYNSIEARMGSELFIIIQK